MNQGLQDQDRSLLGARVTVPQHVVLRDFPSETVILNLQTERYHGLNPTAGQMLGALAGPVTVQDAAKAIAERYSKSRHEVETDMCRLCAQLLERGLIEVSGGTDS